MNNHPLHAQSRALIAKGGLSKQAIHTGWIQANGSDICAPTVSLFSEYPLIASEHLQHRLQQRALDLCQQLLERLRTRPAQWPHAAPADVLTVDYAIIQDAQAEGGWDIRLVEFQAFTSLLATGFLIQQAQQKLCPTLAGLNAWQALPNKLSWWQTVQSWLADSAATVLLEKNPWTRPTGFDLHATSRMFQIPIVEPQDLSRTAQGMIVRRENTESQLVTKILNRLILSDLSADDPAISLLQQAKLAWHSHPAWYFTIHKGMAAGLNLRNEPANVLASHWRSLGLPAEQLVAKQILSYGGQHILLHPDAAQLDALEHQEQWLIQPRFTPFTLCHAADGAPVYAEIRLIIKLGAQQTTGDGAAFQHQTASWIAMQLARLYRGDMASAASIRGLTGEGLSILYNSI